MKINIYILIIPFLMFVASSCDAKGSDGSDFDAESSETEEKNVVSGRNGCPMINPGRSGVPV